MQVEVSLDNIRDVIDERNKALSLLETGESPHPRWIDDIDEIGRPIRRLEEEFLIPKEENKEFLWVVLLPSKSSICLLWIYHKYWIVLSCDFEYPVSFHYDLLWTITFNERIFVSGKDLLTFYTPFWIDNSKPE